MDHAVVDTTNHAANGSETYSATLGANRKSHHAITATEPTTAHPADTAYASPTRRADAVPERGRNR